LRKALVVSVGTGTGAAESELEDLAAAISKSVRMNNADRTFFVVSSESNQIMLPRILKKAALQSATYEVIQIRNADDIQQTYQDLQEKFRQIRNSFDHVIVDYTSGTKAMTGALIAQGILNEVQWFCYISGKRPKGKGIPAKGTEKLICLQPFFVTAQHKINTAIQFFNNHQFDACLSVLTRIREQTDDPDIINKFEMLEKASQAYALWDKFRHEEAAVELSKLKLSIADKNKKFINMLRRNADKEPYYIADLINNAKRRGTDEKKYDDAVARLYRTIELIAQYWLRKKYDVNTEEVYSRDLPAPLATKWHVDPTNRNPAKIALDQAYELLYAKGDELGVRYMQDHELKDLLNKRNDSILAHGQQHVAESTYTRLLRKTRSYALVVVEELPSRVDECSFPRWIESTSSA
jgi:CRISPR-associated protein (TIGR02710 family)